jgi:hypothetical protein
MNPITSRKAKAIAAQSVRNESGHKPRARTRTPFAATLVLPVLLAALASTPAAFAAGGPNVTVGDQPIEVEGVVVTIDDSVYEPYLASRTVQIPNDQHAGRLDFDIPDGKRLIIESVTFLVFTTEVLTPQTVRVDLRARVNGSDVLNHLTLEQQPTGALVGARFAGTHSLKIRVDSETGITDEVGFNLSLGSANAGTFIASIGGYLVDL